MSQNDKFWKRDATDLEEPFLLAYMSPENPETLQRQ